MTDLRDHSQPCEHVPPGYSQVFMDGYHIGHYMTGAPGRQCPGGREVTIDYEAANKEAKRWSRAVNVHIPLSAVPDIVAAALGGDRVDYEVDTG